MTVTNNRIILHVPKTAGSSVRWNAMKVDGIQFYNEHGCLSNLNDEYKDLRSVGFIRDPETWYMSMYNFAKDKYINRGLKHENFTIMIALSDEFKRSFQETLPLMMNLTYTFEQYPQIWEEVKKRFIASALNTGRSRYHSYFPNFSKMSPKDFKNRSLQKNLITFIYTYKDIGVVQEFTNDELKEISKEYWPGNNTLIFKVFGRLQAFRIPKENNVLSLMESSGLKLMTTSANISGDKPCETKEEFRLRFPNIKLLEEEFTSTKSKIPSNIYIVSKKKIQKIR